MTDLQGADVTEDKQEQLEQEYPELEQPSDEATVGGEDMAPEVSAEPESERDTDPPPIVLRHAPDLAELWSELSAQQQQAALDRIARRIDRGEQTDAQKAAPAGSSERKAAESVALAANDLATPERFGPDDLTALQEAFGGDDRAVKALAKLANLAVWAAQTTETIGHKALAALDEGGQTARSLADRLALEEAKAEYARDLGGLRPSQRSQAVDLARQFKASGRAENFSDAMYLALREVRKTAPPTAAKSAKADLAAALAPKLRRGGPTSRRSPGYDGNLSNWIANL